MASSRFLSTARRFSTLVLLPSSASSRPNVALENWSQSGSARKVVSQVDFTIEDLGAADNARIEGAAILLHAAFAPLGAWTTIPEARQEVLDSIASDRVSRVAVAGDGDVLGWIGAIREYDGLVWQLHPIVVDEAQRRRGIGRALILDLEALLIARGGITLWAGSDDLAGETSPR